MKELFCLPAAEIEPKPVYRNLNGLSNDISNGNKKAFSIISGDHIGEDEFGHYITMEDYALAVDCGEECF